MRVLVTGSSGFVGHHLIAELQAHGHTALGLDTVASPDLSDDAQYIASVVDAPAVEQWIEQSQPDACIHLAGIAFVPRGWSHPHEVMDVNVGGTLNILESFRRCRPAARILVVTSAEVYGRAKRPEPVRETHALKPSNIYGVSKAAADLTSLLYYPHYELPVMTARPQNHIGPGQSRLFVVTAFAEQVREIARSGDANGVLRVGNLDSRRDFTDVRDVVHAYRLLIERGEPGQAYNIASARMVPIRDMLDQLCAHAGITPRLERDESRYRPTDRPPRLSIDKIANDVGWRPSIPLTQTLNDIYDTLVAGA